jgi:(p)ppGpp synthase/HD superfamily hydrolase
VTYAQTNVQLFNQLQRLGYSKDECQRVFEGYEFGMRIFSGLILPFGKPFIDHLVGTASILASLRVPTKLVVAGLIHAAYLHGDFGGFRTGATRRNRQRVRRVVGEETEAYIVAYHRLLWTPKKMLALQDGVDELSSMERDVLLIRLANELEHHLDLGALYFARNETERKGHQRHIGRHGPLMVTMAEKLGQSSLADEMKATFDSIVRYQDARIPFNESDLMVAYLVPPKSYRLRLWMSLFRGPINYVLKEGKHVSFKYARVAKQLFLSRAGRIDAK